MSEAAGWQDGRTAGAAGALTELRQAIEALDEELIALLARRVALAREAGRLKRGAGLVRLDPAREAAVVRRGTARARAAGLPDEEVREILWRVVGLCREVQAP